MPLGASPPPGQELIARLSGWALLGELFHALVQEAELLTVFWDGESYQLDLLDRAGQRRRANAEEIEVLLLQGTGRRKRCHGPCAKDLPLPMYSRNRSYPDGRANRCKVCERARVK